MAQTDSVAERIAGATALYLLVMFSLLLVFILVVYVIIRYRARRWGRNWRQGARHTSSEDVWSMHHVPEDFLDADNDDGSVD